MAEIQNYPDLKVNGRLFPLWILANFKKYALPPIERKDGEDPCNKKSSGDVQELRSYQAFIGSILDYRSPYHDALVYHGFGAGKTVAAINVYNIFININLH